ncbi:MAG TPA: hypothetical protein VKA32_00185, partial [Gammaproteobacteria bacterium]|nr:hypothetical protein [Gammaproteobacteria bacterium]
VRTTRGILNYYADRTYTELDSADAAAWWRAHPDGALIVKTKDLDKVFDGGRVPDACRVNRSFEVNLKPYHVIADC